MPETKEKKINNKTASTKTNNNQKIDKNSDTNVTDEKVNQKEQKKVEENYLEISQRIQAEFDNYRKRTLRHSQDAYLEGKIDTIKLLLPILDSFRSAKKGCSPENLKGLTQIENQFIKVFEQLGVEKIEADNKLFDPNLHEAVFTDENADDSIPENTITEVLQDGYMIKDKIIRHSMVKIKTNN